MLDLERLIDERIRLKVKIKKVYAVVWFIFVVVLCHQAYVAAKPFLTELFTALSAN